MLIDKEKCNFSSEVVELIDKFEIDTFIRVNPFSGSCFALRGQKPKVLGIFEPFIAPNYMCHIQLCPNQLHQTFLKYNWNGVIGIFLHEVGHWYDYKIRPKLFLRATAGGEYHRNIQLRRELELQANRYAFQLAKEHDIEIDSNFVGPIKDGLKSHKVLDEREIDMFLCETIARLNLPEAA